MSLGIRRRLVSIPDGGSGYPPESHPFPCPHPSPLSSVTRLLSSRGIWENYPNRSQSLEFLGKIEVGILPEMSAVGGRRGNQDVYLRCFASLDCLRLSRLRHGRQYLDFFFAIFPHTLHRPGRMRSAAGDTPNCSRRAAIKRLYIN